MQEKRILIAVFALVSFISLTVMGISLAQEVKKIDGDVGWVTLDKKTLTLVREGKHLADLELGSAVVVKIMEEQKADKGEAAEGKKEKKKKTEGTAETAKEGKEEAAKEVKKETAPGVTTICYTIRPGTVNDILSGWKASITYAEQGKKKIAKEMTLTPVVFGGDEEE